MVTINSEWTPKGLKTDKYLFWISLNFCDTMSSFSLAFSACYQQYNIFKDFYNNRKQESYYRVQYNKLKFKNDL